MSLDNIINGPSLESAVRLKFASCEPVTILAATSMAVSAGGAVTSIIGQNTSRQLAKGTENQKRLAQEDLMIENRKRATNDYLRQVRLEQKGMDVSRQADAATGTAIASAAERGVAGRSVDQVVSDYQYQENLEIGRLRQNQDMRNVQHSENIAGYQDEFTQRVSAVKPYVPRPQAPVDYFGPIFGIGKDAASTGMAMFPAKK